MPGRIVSALVTDGDRGYRAVGPFELDEPHWAEVGPVREVLRAELGVDAVVLRLVSVTGADGGLGGHVTYHADALAPLDDPVPVPADVAALLAPAPRRAAWASVGGIRVAWRWAKLALAAAGRPATGPPDQVKTWNLAGLWRVPTAAGPAWLKVAAAFSSDEAAAVDAVALADPTLVPAVLGSDGRFRLLLDEVPGVAGWDPSPDLVAATVARWAAAQAALAASPDPLPAGLPAWLPAGLPSGVPTGVPRRPLSRLAAAVTRLLDGAAGAELDAEERAAAYALVAELPARVAELDACGLPETLVHGDFHPGNWQGPPAGPATVLDWADCFVGHPVVDGLRPRPFLDDARWEVAAAAWTATWSGAVPGADPARALAVAEPLAMLHHAVRYQEFLDGIEDSERPYHEGDPAGMIRRALGASPP